MPYIAKKRMKIAHDAKTNTPIFVEFGQPISTEGWDWRTVETYARGGLIERVPEPLAVAASAAKDK